MTTTPHAGRTIDHATTTTRPDRSHLLLLAGPTYAALLVLAAAAFPAPPHGDVAAATQPAWLAVHSDAVIAQGYVRAAAAVAFAVMGVAVAALARRCSANSLVIPAATGGAVCAGFMLAAQAAALGSAQLVKAGGGDDAVRALGHLQDAFLDMSSLPAVLLFAATAVLALRTPGLPRWIGGLSLLGIPLAIVDAASYDGGPLEAVGLVGLAYFLVWSLVTGVRLLSISSAKR